MEALFQPLRDIPTENLLAYLAFINIMTFLAYWQDKRAAQRGGWRTPEATLHTLMLGGGTLGAWLGQQRLRHKTQKQPFQTVFKLLVVIQTFTIIAFFVTG
jgi:uncharacterized membrane protein YsdA (DUF1294 family)